MSGPMPAGPRGVVGLVNLVLIGPMGSGKSSIAREIARLTGRRCVDTDRLIIDHTGSSISEIFSTHGEAHFRELETEALSSLEPCAGLVVATGGGIVTQEENIVSLQRLGLVVWLTAREDVLFERVSRNRRRPLLHTVDPQATLRALLEKRRALYAACAHLTVDTSDDSHAKVAETILERSGELLLAGAERGVPDASPRSLGSES